MKVKTDYEDCDYITAGKVYDVEDCNGFGGEITSDHGSSIYIFFKNCSHLKCARWEVLDD